MVLDFLLDRKFLSSRLTFSVKLIIIAIDQRRVTNLFGAVLFFFGSRHEIVV